MQVYYLISYVFLCILAHTAFVIIPIESLSTRSDTSSFHHGHLLLTNKRKLQGGRLFLSNESEQDALLNKASQLRKEAQELEKKLPKDKTSEGRASSSTGGATAIPSSYTSLDNSNWTISYRFASDPPPKEDDGDGTVMEQKLLYYSGKVSIRFRQDGYTDILTTTDPKSSPVTFVKFWGWDTEISEEDGETYLSFSSDVVLPSNDLNYNDGASLRFYFNAKVEESEADGVLSIRDGTVTVKRDVQSPGGGFWGVFNGGGILAQFRYCGEFLIKPSC